MVFTNFIRFFAPLGETAATQPARRACSRGPNRNKRLNNIRLRRFRIGKECFSRQAESRSKIVKNNLEHVKNKVKRKNRVFLG